MLRSPYPLVEVRWHDACSKDEWVTLEDIPTVQEVITVGYLLRKDDKEVVLSMSWGVNGGDEFGPTFAIPRGMIKQIKMMRRLKVKDE